MVLVKIVNEFNYFRLRVFNLNNHPLYFLLFYSFNLGRWPLILLTKILLSFICLNFKTWSLAVITLNRMKTTVSWYGVWLLLLNVLIRQFKTSLLIKLCLFFFFCQITRKINFNLVLKLYFQICRRRWLITYQLIHLNVANCSSDIYLWFTSLAILWSTISTPYIF